MNRQSEADIFVPGFDDTYLTGKKPSLLYRAGHKVGSLFSTLKRGTRAGVNAVTEEMHEQLADIANEIYLNQEMHYAEQLKALRRKYLLTGIISTFVGFIAGGIVAIISLI
ncbi:hypothetical protein SAMN05660772_02457 [Pasteurella testudinis DSM 23072]|uniref:Uncharacterized protein n=1 Tax=Pasteurella testudinis DSM 23072 TaxID=1122938 RepID=A0A1W1UW85_9PAST|nr:hypothetical protein [Pasteurella testudinis]SMB85259.1 hypothetical protein SAMN05660772_02457 [Pasteurella testudinis DSM 23072]SUB52146.1 Uncharacterised protein [Pasteurella testudinis]